MHASEAALAISERETECRTETETALAKLLAEDVPRNNAVLARYAAGSR
jgi:hypothetical protein